MPTYETYRKTQSLTNISHVPRLINILVSAALNHTTCGFLILTKYQTKLAYFICSSVQNLESWSILFCSKVIENIFYKSFNSEESSRTKNFSRDLRLGLKVPHLPLAGQSNNNNVWTMWHKKKMEWDNKEYAFEDIIN